MKALHSVGLLKRACLNTGSLLFLRQAASCAFYPSMLTDCSVEHWSVECLVVREWAAA